MMGKILSLTLLILLCFLCSPAVPALAEETTTLNLSTSIASSGETVTASGTSAADTWVAVKVLDSAGSIVVFDFIQSAADGEYSYTFIVPPVADGILRVIAGPGSNVAKAELTVGEHHDVTVSANPAEGGTTTGGGIYLKGTSVTVTATPNSGYTFVNWTENSTSVSTSAVFTFTLDTSDRTLAANFIVTPPDPDGCLVTYRGAQKRYHADSHTYDIRFIATINTLNADAVGFVFSKSQQIPTLGNATVKSTTTVYTSVTADNTTVTAASLEGTYIIACTVTGIPEDDKDIPLYVRAFSTVGTETNYTPAATVTVNSLP